MHRRRVITSDHVDDLCATLARELPGFRIGYKDESAVQRAIGALVRPFNDQYMTHYTTVMFGAVWFPSEAWRREVGPRALYEILRHEAVHLRDARRYWGWFHVSYVLLFPAVFTMRAHWEWRAYVETLRVNAELDGAIPDSLLRFIEDRFIGPDYLFMFPFRGFIRARLEKARAEILAELDAAPAQT